jgi:hypothetical protein
LGWLSVVLSASYLVLGPYLWTAEDIGNKLVQRHG